jgi:hypothetical protein
LLPTATHLKNGGPGSYIEPKTNAEKEGSGSLESGEPRVDKLLVGGACLVVECTDCRVEGELQVLIEDERVGGPAELEVAQLLSLAHSLSLHHHGSAARDLHHPDFD